MISISKLSYSFGRPDVQYHRPVKRGPAKVNILE